MNKEQLLKTEAGTLIWKERRRQIYGEAFVPHSDDKLTTGQLALGAMCYLHVASHQLRLVDFELDLREWKLDKRFWKPSTVERNLIKGGALLLAENERLERLADRTFAKVRPYDEVLGRIIHYLTVSLENVPVQ